MKLALLAGMHNAHRLTKVLNNNVMISVCAQTMGWG